ncbi:MAG: hypothetical protein R6U11_05255 [Bacteroidales bacterium]
MGKKVLFAFLFVLLVIPSCRTYYQKHREFNNLFASGRLEEAAQILDNDKKAKKKRNKILYLMNQGTVNHLLGNYYKSNEYFEEAYILGEDYLKDYLNETLALFSNPKVTEYKGEDFELLLIHYYKAMNFIQLKNYDAALVECRRMNNKLNVLNDKFKSNRRYRRDAFIHNLMGIIYDATGEYNNAFVAYRNAYNAYSEDYQELFGVDAPEQLKQDLLRTAYKNGFKDQVEFYESLFETTYQHKDQNGEGELVFFWQNGLGPVKEEWSINFVAVRGSGGQVTFVNEELGLSFDFHLSPGQNPSNTLGDLKTLKIAFPKFVERRRVYHAARIRINSATHKLQHAQDINAIAFKSLEDRMLREFGKALLRLAVKQTTEAVVRKENQSIGAILGLAGTISEQADTRNWQTLPHSIYYTRIQLPKGQQQLALELINRNGNTARTVNLKTNIKPGQTSFINFHTLDAMPPEIY